MKKRKKRRMKYNQGFIAKSWVGLNISKYAAIIENMA